MADTKPAAKSGAKSGAKSVAKRTAKAKADTKPGIKPKPVTLHYAPTPNGKKITIMLEEARIPYKLKRMTLGEDGDQFKPGFLKISPNNKMPALVDPDPAFGKSGAKLGGEAGGNKFSLFESGAILIYLGRKYGAFYPITEAERSRVEQWLMFQMASIGPMSGQAYHFMTLAEDEPARAAYGRERYMAEVQRLYRVMDTHLSKQEWFADAVSIADFAIYPWIFPKLVGDVWEECEHLRAWHARMGARDGVKRGMAVE